MAKRQQDFIRAMVAEDMKTGKYGGRVVTRFPPEPNGYLHIGHAKAICLDFGIAQENAGVCHLRFDDTNPESEDVKFVESIKEDVRWLGFDCGEKLFFASDYFERLYDFTHCLSDAIEQITHSLCTLEFKDNRALYDWVLNAAAIEPPRPEQTEFARLNLDYTVLSKRKLVQVVEQGLVDGWDDPRMPTIAGLRRRGVTPEAIRTFCDMIGVARVDSRVDMEKLEYAIRDDLNKKVPRVMCVLRPLKVVILNYPEDQVEELDAPHYPRDVPQEGSRKVPFTRELYIERDDFMEHPPEKFFRLAPGREVRLRHAYLVKCVDVIKDDSGEITEIHCTYDPETKSGTAPDGRKVKGTIHWVSAAHSLPAEVRLYDRLFLKADPDDVAEGEDFTSNLNLDSKVVLTESRIEPSVADAPPGSRYQFERQGYFVSDVVDSSRDNLMFNRTVGLRDTWAKITVADSAEKGERRERGGRTAREGVTKPRQRTVADDRGASPKVAALTARFAGEFGLSDEQAKALAGDPTLATLFEEAVAVHDHPKTIASWIVGEVSRRLKQGEGKSLPFTGAQVAALVTLIDDGTISRTTAKDVFAEMSERGDHPAQIVERRGLRQLSDPKTIEPLVNKLVAENPDKAAQYRAGRTGLLGFFVGQVMKESGGRANPELVKEMVEARLS